MAIGSRRTSPMLAELGGGALRGHGGADEYAVFPVEGLVDQRGQMRAAAAEDDRRNRHAVMVLGAERMRRALRQRRGEAAVGMRAHDRLAVLVLHARLPGPALPVDAFRGRLAVAAFPPYRAVLASARRWYRWCCWLMVFIMLGLVFELVPGRHAEEAGLRD